MRLSEFEGEEALDLLADLLDPFAEIMTDKEVSEKYRGNNRTGAVKAAIKGHKRAVIEILARLDKKDPDEYRVTVFTLPMKLLEIFNDPDLVNLFQSQGQTSEEASSGSATENTEADGA